MARCENDPQKLKYLLKNLSLLLCVMKSQEQYMYLQTIITFITDVYILCVCVCVCVLTFQIVLITLEFERKMLSINSQTVHTACVDGEISVITSANMPLKTRTGGGGAGHGLSVLGDLACVALDKSLGLLLKVVDRFLDRKIRGEKHDAHGGIGILPVDLLHRPGEGGIVDTEDACPLDGGENRLGLEEGSEGKRGERRELHR